MDAGMIKRVCGLKFDLKVNQEIIDLLKSNGYLVEKKFGGEYNIFKKVEEDDTTDDDKHQI